MNNSGSTYNLMVGIVTKEKLWGINFWLLLLYSLLPGIYKIMGSQVFMLMSAPIILSLLYAHRKSIVLRNTDVPMLLFTVYILLQSIVWIILFPEINKLGVAMGMFMNVIPMTGYLLAKGINFDYFAHIMVRIIAIHGVIGILLYPPFGITSVSNPIVNALVEGVAFARMSSVSGSLGFGNLLMIGFVLSFFFDKRFLPLMFICLMFSAQRSAWVGGFFVLAVYMFEMTKSARLTKVFSLLVVGLLCVVVIFLFLTNYLGVDLDFIAGRFSRLDSAGSERDFLWKAGIDNFIHYPFGTGLGQVGQMATRMDAAESVFATVPDGDYFRVLSESGIVGGLFYVWVLILFFLILLLKKLPSKTDQAIIALMGGELIQMVGSNITEFYFTNFVYWVIMGYFFTFTQNKVFFRKTGNI